jgi:hypothetical protein
VHGATNLEDDVGDMCSEANNVADEVRKLGRPVPHALVRRGKKRGREE